MSEPDSESVRGSLLQTHPDVCGAVATVGHQQGAPPQPTAALAQSSKCSA